MAKKQLLFADAERLYVIDHCTLGEIASRLGIHEKTVGNWKDEGDWDNKRRRHLAGKQAFHEELYDFTRKLMRSISNDLDNGNKVDPGRMFAFNNLVGRLKNVKEYEDVMHQKEKEDEKKGSGGITEETLRIIEEELGIR